MKKLIVSLFCILILSFLMLGCKLNINSITLNSKKPNNFYYTNILAKNLTLESSYKCIVVDTNFYKEKEMSKDNISSISSMLKQLNKNNFIAKPKDLPEKPIYKILLTFSKDKMVINVYNEKYISIHPWDGKFTMDYIDMTTIPAQFNIQSICQYIFK